MTEQTDRGFKNTKLNGGKITEHLQSEELDIAEDFISQVYYRGLYEPMLSLPKHGFVMCQTRNGKNFICHIYQPDAEVKELVTEIRIRAWAPYEQDVTPPMTLSNPKRFNALRDYVCETLTPKFNGGLILPSYVAALNDCRHFAEAVIEFLKS